MSNLRRKSGHFRVPPAPRLSSTLALLWVAGQSSLAQDLRREVRHFWQEMVPEAIKGGAPKAGNSTLLFIHCPKTAGSSMETVLQGLVDRRRPPVRAFEIPRPSVSAMDVLHELLIWHLYPLLGMHAAIHEQ